MSAPEFSDHFSGHARQYAEFRPGYPPRLFSFIHSLTREHQRAWDCGTGSGQAAARLADHYKQVIATDPSAQQIRNAERVPGVVYVVAPAERSGLADASVDVITVAQALHWFDLTAFYTEAERVSRPGAALVVWCYGLMKIGREVDAVVAHYYNQVVGPYWPPERRYIEQGYRTLPFPYAEYPAPDLAMYAHWDLDAMCNYLATWSATRRYIEQLGRDPIPRLREELSSCWGVPTKKHTVSWPLIVRAGKIGDGI